MKFENYSYKHVFPYNYSLLFTQKMCLDFPCKQELYFYLASFDSLSSLTPSDNTKYFGLAYMNLLLQYVLRLSFHITFYLITPNVGPYKILNEHCQEKNKNHIFRL